MKYNRVLIFSTDDHLYPAGGAEQAFGHITERLPHITFDLVCARIRRHALGREVVGNINIYRIGFGIPKIDGIILALFGHFYAYWLMKKNSYDLIWSIMASYGAFSAVRVRKRKNIPFLLTLQEGDSFEYIYDRVKYVRSLFNEIFRSADAIQAISRYLLIWGKEMGYGGEHGCVIPNGVIIKSFSHSFPAEVVQEKRNSFGFSKGAYILMTSSRLEKKNGIKDVILALPQLPKEVCFVVCGSGSCEDEIRVLVQKLGLQERVRFLGFVQPTELPLIMKASDVFIRPSLTEGLGNAFLEAMAAQLLVVGTDAGGIPDFLTDGKTGFVVEKENPNSITRVISKITSLDPTTKREILDTALRMVKDRYDWDRIASDMEQLFNEVSA